MDTVKVVCGIIFHDSKVLICRRKPNRSLGGFWEFPGGKIEDGEKNEESLCRELMEELGMEVVVLDFFKSQFHNYDSFKIELIAYRCNFIRASFDLSDHDAYEWVGILDLNKWKLAPADIPIAEELIFSEAKKHNNNYG